MFFQPLRHFDNNALVVDVVMIFVMATFIDHKILVIILYIVVEGTTLIRFCQAIVRAIINQQRRLKLRRTVLGLTQEQVALECGISYQQIHKYESGQSKMSTARLVRPKPVVPRRQRSTFSLPPESI